MDTSNIEEIINKTLETFKYEYNTLETRERISQAISSVLQQTGILEYTVDVNSDSPDDPISVTVNVRKPGSIAYSQIKSSMLGDEELTEDFNENLKTLVRETHEENDVEDFWRDYIIRNVYSELLNKTQD